MTWNCLKFGFINTQNEQNWKSEFTICETLFRPSATNSGRPYGATSVSLSSYRTPPQPPPPLADPPVTWRLSRDVMAGGARPLRWRCVLFLSFFVSFLILQKLGWKSSHFQTDLLWQRDIRCFSPSQWRPHHWANSSDFWQFLLKREVFVQKKFALTVPLRSGNGKNDHHLLSTLPPHAQGRVGGHTGPLQLAVLSVDFHCWVPRSGKKPQNLAESKNKAVFCIDLSSIVVVCLFYRSDHWHVPAVRRGIVSQLGSEDPQTNFLCATYESGKCSVPVGQRSFCSVDMRRVPSRYDGVCHFKPSEVSVPTLQDKSLPRHSLLGEKSQITFSASFWTVSKEATFVYRVHRPWWPNDPEDATYVHTSWSVSSRKFYF